MRKIKETSVKITAPELVPDNVMLAERRLSGSCGCCGMGNAVCIDWWFVNSKPFKDHHKRCFWRLHVDSDSDYTLEKVYTKYNTCALFKRKRKAPGPHSIAVYIDEDVAYRYKHYRRENT